MAQGITVYRHIQSSAVALPLYSHHEVMLEGNQKQRWIGDTQALLRYDDGLSTPQHNFK